MRTSILSVANKPCLSRARRNFAGPVSLRFYSPAGRLHTTLSANDKVTRSTISPAIRRSGCDLKAQAYAPTAPQSVAYPAGTTAELEHIANLINIAPDAKQRYRLLLDFAKQLPPLAECAKTPINRVMGCTAQVWVTAELDAEGKVVFEADSDSELTRGLAAILVKGLSGLTPDEVLQVDPNVLKAFDFGPGVLTPSRSNGFLNVLQTMHKRTRALLHDLPRFPSLVVTADSVIPQGSFAEAQAKYLQPDAATVDRLVSLLTEKRIGVVAHFYMDPEVQGVLTAAGDRWPHLHISDSLVMADSAVKMAQAGCRAIAVLGVDFMSENVRAILDEAGHRDVQVYRLAEEAIGCSLAEAAESDNYARYLAEAQATPRSLHVIYINTSLRTKAHSHAAVPTITCTSSNVVQTVLQAFAQVPDATVWYGPDTYMGRNLAQLFTSLAAASDEDIRALHPAHSQASLRALLPRLRYFQQGTCIVHHIFGGETTEAVREGYPDAFLTAHFEVPGDMFSLAMQARRQRGMGVVGSTQNILDFIAAKLDAALANPFPDRLQFVLGTESGMITSIVRKVQGILRAAGRSDVQVEVVFPVASEAITTDRQQPSAGAVRNGEAVDLPGALTVVPGPAAGEGCSMQGGCASCPYMKMNSLSSLLKVCERVGTPGEALLERYKPKLYAERLDGRSIAQAGCEPILHMRAFQQSKALPDALVQDILSRNAAA